MPLIRFTMRYSQELDDHIERRMKECGHLSKVEFIRWLIHKDKEESEPPEKDEKEW